MRIYIYIYIYICIRTYSLRNVYRQRKWTRQPEFVFGTRLFAFSHTTYTPLERHESNYSSHPQLPKALCQIYPHFRINTLGKGMNPLILPAIG